MTCIKFKTVPKSSIVVYRAVHREGGGGGVRGVRTKPLFQIPSANLRVKLI